MNDNYNPAKIESKWQKKWAADQLYRSWVDWSKPKHYALTMLPYPSGDLHIGHWFAMTPSDTRARYMRMKGYNVLFPMGFDAFGLPAENAAVQHNIHPKRWTYANIENMRKQLKSMGAMFDWKREAISCEPKYYRWTEWFFKKLHEAGLAYRGEALVNWSPTLQTVLANEQVIDGRDERNGQPVIQKMMTQWFFRITKYAEGLLDFSKLDWPEPIKIMQTNWIGRSEGAWVTFHTEQGDPIEIFTTRPDTLWGATFMVLAPEHPLVEKVTSAQQRKTVEAYKAQAARVTEIERTNEEREKSGVFTGGYAINPVNNERIPIWIADYVLITYGSGAIMAVPAHDERDFAFARKYGIEVRVVIQPDDSIQPAGQKLDGATMTDPFVGAGVMFNSGSFDGTPCNEEKGRKNPGISAVIDWLEKKGIGREAVNYRLRDWLISRQRYWGAPIPAIHTQDGKIESVPEESLPVLLPDDVQFMPTGQSPLLFHLGFLNTSDSQGRPARRETDTMDTFMCSSWYQYRYLSPDYDKEPFDPEEAAYWLPVDVYTGGAEHATMHLMYTRFFTKAMIDLGILKETREAMKAHGRNPDELIDEPMIVLRNQGQILGEERGGNFILAKGRWEGKKLVADYVEVINSPDKTADPGAITGEIMHRTENILQVDTGGEELQVVEVSAEAKVVIASIPGENNVNQLMHHLEIQRMSKSKGNVVDPDELVARYGADTVRGYLMFAFDWTKGGPWDSQGILGVHRFLNDVWRLINDSIPAARGAAGKKDVRALRRKVHQTIQRVTFSLESFSFNTGMAALMELKNAMSKARSTPLVHTPAWDEAVRTLLLLMAPFTPHIAEELWGRHGDKYSIHQQSWPQADPAIAAEEEIELVVQVNGKVRDRIRVPADISEEDAKKAALTSEAAQRFMEGKPPRKVVVVPGKLVNIVI
jgi:leucyl-tRNA synthetase